MNVTTVKGRALLDLLREAAHGKRPSVTGLKRIRKALNALEIDAPEHRDFLAWLEYFPDTVQSLYPRT